MLRNVLWTNPDTGRYYWQDQYGRLFCHNPDSGHSENTDQLIYVKGNPAHGSYFSPVFRDGQQFWDRYGQELTALDFRRGYSDFSYEEICAMREQFLVARRLAKLHALISDD